MRDRQGGGGLLGDDMFSFPWEMTLAPVLSQGKANKPSENTQIDSNDSEA